MNRTSQQAVFSGLSPEAQAVLAKAIATPKAAPPSPDDCTAWSSLQERVEARSVHASECAIAQFEPLITTQSWAGMHALYIQPQLCAPHTPPIIYLHGGGYTTFSARSSLFATIPMAAGLERSIISLDYPLAPQSRFEETVPAVARSLDAILGAHHGAVLMGDSAGGGLAVAVCNRLLENGKGPPAAVALISPWTDLANRGDSRVTQCDHDPILGYEPALAACAAAYARDRLDHTDASPIHAAFGPDFPPTLIICGTREILLSDSVRLAQRLQNAGAKAELDVHDGLFHSFPVLAPHSPEASRGRERIKRFLESLEVKAE